MDTWSLAVVAAWACYIIVTEVRRMRLQRERDVLRGSVSAAVLGATESLRAASQLRADIERLLHMSGTQGATDRFQLFAALHSARATAAQQAYQRLASTQEARAKEYADAEMAKGITGSILHELDRDSVENEALLKSVGELQRATQEVREETEIVERFTRPPA